MIFYTKLYTGLVFKVGFSFMLDPALNISPKPQLQKVLSCRHLCHTWDWGLGTPCEVVSPNFHALNGQDCIHWSQMNRDLGLGPPCAPAHTLSSYQHGDGHSYRMSGTRSKMGWFFLPFIVPRVLCAFKIRHVIRFASLLYEMSMKQVYWHKVEEHIRIVGTSL